MGTLRRFKGVRGQPGVKCGPKGCQWTPLTQRLPNWCHTWCLTCSRVFQIFLFFSSCFFVFFNFFKNNNEKCEFKIPASEVVQFSNDSDGNFSFLVAKFVWFTFEKIHVLCIFSKVNQKNLATKKLKLPSESLDNFASCHAAVFKLHKVSLFF